MRRPLSTVLAVVLTLTFAGSPLHAAEPAPPLALAAGSPRGAFDVSGTYDSNWGQVTLRQSGQHVSGSYVCCQKGAIEGQIEGNVIRYRWAQGDGAGPGRGVWAVSSTGELIGSWGIGQSEVNGGGWNLRRASSTPPPASAQLAR